MSTPFIKTIRQSGGTFYSFSSSSEDLNFLLNDSEERSFAFSKFVLLNLPDESRPTAKKENYIQYDAIPGAFTQVDGKTPDVKLAESFQNYCLNLETILTNDDAYSIKNKRSVNERVFFKWLKELGALRFRQANDFEKSVNATGARFVEEIDSDFAYNKVVQYIGEIDMINATKLNKNSYTEVYVHVPISHGNSKTVLFNTINDENYLQNKAYQYAPQSALDAPYIFGRNANDDHPVGLSTKAIYDSESSTFITNKYTLKKEITENDGSTRFINGWYYDFPLSNSYVTSKDFSDQHNDNLKIIGSDEYIGKEVNVSRSRLDGISIDFDEQNYRDIVSDPNIDNFAEYAQSRFGSAFQFNAVLVYYDVYEKATPTDRTTNLFGVLFLDKPTSTSGGGSTINRLSKYKPNEVTGDNGNAWGLKINLKLDLNANDAQIETIVNEYNTYSMELFLESMTELKKLTDSLDTTNEQFVKLNDKILEIEDYVYRTQNVTDISTKYAEMQKLISDNFSVFSSNQDLINLINKAFTDINNIYNNKTSVEIAYNLDVLDDGYGIRFENLNSKKVISHALQNYDLNAKTVYSIVNDFSIELNKHVLKLPVTKYSNMVHIEENGYTNEQNFILTRDINILFDDTLNQWKKGQTYRVGFGTTYLPTSDTNFNINFYTDATDRKRNGVAYGVKMNIINIGDFIFKFKKYNLNLVDAYIPPIIDITCVDEIKMLFTFNIY